MAKKRKHNISKRAKIASQKNNPKKSQKKRVSWGIILAIVSLGISLIAFWPRLSVDCGESLDSQNPFKTSFVVKNEGYVFCYPVHYSLAIKKVELENNINLIDIGITGFDEDIPKLCPNDSSTFSLQRTIAIPPNFLKSAEIYIDLSYKPSWLPSWLNNIFQDSYRFKVARKANGDYVWQKYYTNK
jgi:hypothetical protein